MKLTALTSAALLTAALGWTLAPTLAGPADPPADEAQQAEQRAPQAIEEVAFLGVDFALLGPEARRSLDLKPGTGLAIRNVGPGTPAEEAGLLPGDVLVRLNDQLIINGPQLAVLVRTHEPGDKVSLHILRDGEPMQLNATLAGRVAAPRPMIERVPMPHIHPMPDFGDFDTIFDRLRGPGMDPFAPDADVQEMFDQMQRRMFEQRNEMQRMMDQMRKRIGGEGAQSMISVNDGEHVLQLRSDGQQKRLTVNTLDGDLIFEGPLPEDGQIEDLPDDVQKKVDDLLKNNRIELRLPEPRPRNRKPLPVA